MKSRRGVGFGSAVGEDGLVQKFKRNRFGLGIGVSTLAILMMGVWLLGRSSSPQATSEGTISVAEPSQNFGSVALDGGDVFLEYEMKNTGSEPVRITRIATSCMCTKAKVRGADGRESPWGGMEGHVAAGPANLNWTVQPGEKVAVVADFNPAAHGPAGVGYVRREIFLNTDSREAPVVNLTLQGNVISS